jgi:DNA-binding IscR family transcriptional regulator
MSTPNIENYLKVSDSRALDVLFWLLHHRDEEDIVSTTLDAVAADCEVTKVTVNRVFQKLYAQKFLVKIRNGQYKLQNL